MVAATLAVILGSAQPDGQTGVVTKANFTEKLRVESLTEQEGFSSRTQTAQEGKWTLDFEVTGLAGPLLLEDEVSLSVGAFTLVQKISDDPDFQQGGRKATLHKLAEGTSPTRPILATAELSWSGSKLRGKVSGRVPLLAEEAARSGGSEFRIGTQMKGRIGSLTFGASLMGTGKSKRAERTAGPIDASVLEVTLSARLPKGVRVSPQ